MGVHGAPNKQKSLWGGLDIDVSRRVRAGAAAAAAIYR